MRRLIGADTITEIYQWSRGTYGRNRVRAALLADYEMNVNHKLVNSIMSEHGLYRLSRPGRRKPNLMVSTRRLTWSIGGSLQARPWSSGPSVYLRFSV